MLGFGLKGMLFSYMIWIQFLFLKSPYRSFVLKIFFTLYVILYAIKDIFFSFLYYENKLFLTKRCRTVFVLLNNCISIFERP